MGDLGSLDGRVALITGGSRGIGFGIAQAFVDDGATVVITGRSDASGEKAIGELGSRASFVQSDVMAKASVEAAVDAVIERHGQLDCLVNNAGGVEVLTPIAEMSDEVWDDTLTFNLTSVFWTTRHALKYMLPRQSGSVINISSLEGKIGQPTLTHYGAAKHGLHGLTKGLAHELGQSGITVNAICPGLVLTDLVRERMDMAAQAWGVTTEQVIQSFVERGALKRPTTVEECGAVAVLLASDGGRAITGTAISVDGGVAPF